mgnify:FL=1
MKTTLTINKSLDDKISMLQKMAEEEVKDRLEYIANYAVVVSPVKTGAYVESFSFAVGAGRPRGKSSANRPMANRDAAMQDARANLYSDIDKMDLKKSDKVTLRNGSPHAVEVEKKHSVFTKVRNKFGG